MPPNLDGLLWLLLLLGPILLLQRSLHREIRAIFLLLTRREDITIVLFSILFFPGILLHESSHYVMARLLRVRTRRFSLIPRPLKNGRLQLGFVETASTDWARDAFIGAAPLLTGGLFVAYAGLVHLGLPALWRAISAGDTVGMLEALPNSSSQTDFWLWFYLTLVVSSTMLPSETDRRAWLPMGLIVVLLLSLSLFLGAGPWLVQNLAAPLNRVLQAVALVLGISVLVHLIFLFPLWVIRRLLAWMLRLEVVI